MTDNELGKNDKTRVFFERPNFIMAKCKSKKRTANNRRGRVVIIGAGSSRWRRIWIAGTRLVFVGLVVAGLGLVSASARRCSLVQDW